MIPMACSSDPDPAPRSGARRRRHENPLRGTTLIEVMVVLTILVVASGLFSRIVIATSRLRDVNRENATAAEAARKILEEMRNQEFQEIFELYDPDPNDDPDGPATAPGHRHDVPGLNPTSDSPDGKVLEVVLPAFPPATASKLIGTPWEARVLGTIQGSGGGSSGSGSGSGPGGKLGGIAGGSPPATWELREDYQDEELSLPRDLNGDSILDSLDHSDDYILLPILIRVKWQGRYGPRVYEVYTMLAEYRKSS